MSEQLWKAYREKRTDENRNALVMHYRPSTSFRAARDRLPKSHASVTLEELESAADMALIGAVEKFRDDFDLQFERYAYFRCVGGILDWLRSVDYFNREQRAALNKADEVGMLGLPDSLSDYRGEAEFQEALEVILLGLSPVQLQVFTLHCLENWKMDEIGEDLAMTEGRVSQILDESMQFILSRKPRIYEVLELRDRKGVAA